HLREVMTLVPRVLLSVTLTGPAPSGSTDTSRLCRGCSRPPRRFPDQAAPSFTAPLRQGQRWKVFHLHSNRQRLTAHVDRGLVRPQFGCGRAVWHGDVVVRGPVEGRTCRPLYGTL